MRKFRYLGLVAIGLSLGLLFQNCGEGFQSMQLSSLGGASFELLMPPQAKTTYTGESLLLSSAAYSEPDMSLSYQWKKDGEELLGQTAPTLNIANVTAVDSGSYSLVITASTVSPSLTDTVVETQPVQVEVRARPTENIEPQIISSSSSTYVAEGGKAFLRVRAEGFPVPAIQWWKDGAPLVGQTNDYLLIENASALDSGVYRAEVTNEASVLPLMGPYTLVSVGEPNVAPELMEITQEQNLAAGTAIDLKAEFVGLGAPTYQWFRNDVALAGANQNTLLIEDTTSLNSGNYKIVASNQAGSAEALVAVTVVDGLVLAQAPQNQMIALNGNASFSVLITGTVDTYEWFKDDVLIAGADQNILNIANAQLDDTATYKVRATNISGSIESMAILTVVAPPVIVTAVPNTSVEELGNATLAVAANGLGLTYKWFKNNVEIVGATQSSLNIMNATHLDQANYRVEVTNLAATVPSAADLTVNLLSDGVQLYARDCASCHAPIEMSQKFNRSFAQIKGAMMNVPGMQNVFLTGNDVNRTDAQIQAVADALVLTPPVIVTQPQSQTAAVSSDVTFSVAATGKYLSYQWQRNNVDIGGATQSSLTLTNLNMAQTGEQYRVVVTNAAGSVNSENATLTVLAPPTIVTQPQSKQVVSDSPWSISVAASGDQLSYQWYRDGVPTGANSPTYSIQSANAVSTAAYHVVVSNPSGTVTSGVANIQVVGRPDVILDTSFGGLPSDSPLAGTTVTLAVTSRSPTSNANIIYPYDQVVWMRNGVVVQSGNSPQLVIPNFQSANNGNYSATVSNLFGSVTYDFQRTFTARSFDGIVFSNICDSTNRVKKQIVHNGNMATSTTQYMFSDCNYVFMTVVSRSTFVLQDLVGLDHRFLSTTVSSVHTPMDTGYADYLNTINYCGFNDWVANVPKDTSALGGCDGFGIAGQTVRGLSRFRYRLFNNAPLYEHFYGDYTGVPIDQYPTAINNDSRLFFLGQ